MHDNKDLEVQYIIDSINKQNKIEASTPDYKLTVDDKDRNIEPKKTLTKTKYNASSCYYTITDISGKSITITDADASVKTVTRSQLLPFIQLQNKKS
jgi:uncharacterized protein YlxW (UPF0749 family)